LLRNPELRASMGRRAREVVEERFTVDQMVATVLRNYRSLLDRPGRRSFLERLAC
jgi:glycosyltransferase involved in cell wall biosynthesis